jgi:glycerol dehydrogenase
MTDIFLAPRRYIQREGVLEEAGNFLKNFGTRPLVLGDELVFSIIRPVLENRLAQAGLASSFVLFGGECSPGEVIRLEEIALGRNTDLVIGTGGGKALDTSRLLADRLKVPLIAIPTSAATCSAASSVAVIYEKGVRQATVNGKAADLVLVDSTVLSRAPSRLLAAGMGDSLAKWYEGKPIYDLSTGHDLATQTAMAISTQIREIILAWGRGAKQDVDEGRNSAAVEKIVEANILITGIISGLGGSKLRVALAHAFLFGMTVLPQMHRNLHGETVSYGIVVQLCMEKNERELAILLPFFSSLGLPLTSKELGMDNAEDPRFWEGLRRTCAPGSAVHSLPFPVDEQKVYRAMLEADERAREFKTR